MKTRIFILASIIVLLNGLCYYAWAQQETTNAGSWPNPKNGSQFYASLLGQVAIPQGRLKEYSNVKGGLSVELGKSFRKTPSLSAGIEFSGVITSPKKDQFKGLEITTNTGFMQVLPFVRWAPKKDMKVKPFIDFSAGLAMTWTKTTSKIVDEPTFWNEVLFGDEADVETTTHMDVSSSNLSCGIGAGVMIKKLLMVGVRYYHAQPMEYVDNSTVYVKDDVIHYNTQRIPLDMVVVTIGISNWGSH